MDYTETDCMRFHLYTSEITFEVTANGIYFYLGCKGSCLAVVVDHLLLLHGFWINHVPSYRPDERWCAVADDT